MIAVQAIDISDSGMSGSTHRKIMLRNAATVIIGPQCNNVGLKTIALLVAVISVAGSNKTQPQWHPPSVSLAKQHSTTLLDEK